MPLWFSFSSRFTFLITSAYSGIRVFVFPVHTATDIIKARWREAGWSRGGLVDENHGN